MTRRKKSHYATGNVAEYLILEKGARARGYYFFQEKYSNVKPL